MKTYPQFRKKHLWISFCHIKRDRKSIPATVYHRNDMMPRTWRKSHLMDMPGLPEIAVIHVPIYGGIPIPMGQMEDRSLD